MLLDERSPFGFSVLLRSEDGLLIALSIHHGAGSLAVAGIDAADVERLSAELVARLRDDERHIDTVPITFWTGGAPASPRRRIPAPSWAEVAANYSAATRAALEPLMSARERGAGGLLLWHGAPGTGKSYALRALSREWLGWCDTYFITDPEKFLGSDTSHLLNALLRTDRGPAGDTRHRLVVLEDAGELLAADARVQAGQALSRLLNVSDGVLGAGLRAIVLVTTNEPVRKLHPAVVRPGRCWAEVEFAPLSVDEGNTWLKAQGAGARLGRPMPIAELYALAAGRTLAEPVAVGFAA